MTRLVIGAFLGAGLILASCFLIGTCYGRIKDEAPKWQLHSFMASESHLVYQITINED